MSGKSSVNDDFYYISKPYDRQVACRDRTRGIISMTMSELESISMIIIDIARMSVSIHCPLIDKEHVEIRISENYIIVILDIRLLHNKFDFVILSAGNITGVCLDHFLFEIFLKNGRKNLITSVKVYVQEVFRLNVLRQTFSDIPKNVVSTC